MQSPSHDYQFIAVVPAAGIGSRMGASIPKQYFPIFAKTVLEYSIEALFLDPRIQNVVVALHPNDTHFASLPIAQNPRVHTVVGGDTRAQSVHNALQYIVQTRFADSAAGRSQTDALPAVVVHDAARPCLTATDLSRLLDQFNQDPASGTLLGATVRDTMKRVDTGGQVQRTVTRDNLWHALTPQVFDCAALLQALTKALTHAEAAVTDEASAMELTGVQPVLVPGQGSNIKITHQEDLLSARSFLAQFRQQEKAQPMLRIGQGFDVHKFGGPGPVYLGGVAIEHEFGLLAHSDGDVLLHALCDALLGALALGDIGHLFPDTDPAYKGADSKKLLQDVYQRVTEQGYELVNADITVMAEVPKLKPHNLRIRECIGELIGMPVSAISVKATTTEQLGFTGRQEGIACQATVLLTQSAELNNG